MSAAPAKAPGRPGPARRLLAHPRGALRPPAPLTALLVVAALLGVAWTLVTPAFQAPDENAHFGYVQNMGERFAIPGDPDRYRFSTEQSLASSAANADQVSANPFARMEWSPGAYARWRAADARLGRAGRLNGGGPNPAESNPPLYYLWEAGAYRLAERGDVFTRLQVTRLASVVWMLVTVLGVWLLAGEAFARNRLAQLAAAGTAALAPMIGFVSGSLNPDAMLYAAWSLALWLGLRLLNRGMSVGRVGALLAVVGAACVVKATSYALLPGALLVLVVALRRAHGGRRSAAVAAGAAGLALTLGAWVVVAHVTHRATAGQVTEVTAGAGSSLNLREFVSYLWQFYLPRLPFQQHFPLNAPTIPVYDIWLKQVWGAFGWLEVQFPGWLYVLLTIVTVGVAGLALTGVWRARRTVDRAAVAFIVVTGLALLAGLHWTEYRYLASDRGPFNSGRYLLPMVGVAGLAVARATRMVRPDRRGIAVAAALGGFFALDLFSLGLMLVRFYA